MLSLITTGPPNYTQPTQIPHSYHNHHLPIQNSTQNHLHTLFTQLLVLSSLSVACSTTWQVHTAVRECHCSDKVKIRVKNTQLPSQAELNLHSISHFFMKRPGFQAAVSYATTIIALRSVSARTVEHEGFFSPCLYLIPQFRPGENQRGKGEGPREGERGRVPGRRSTCCGFPEVLGLFRAEL